MPVKRSGGSCEREYQMGMLLTFIPPQSSLVYTIADGRVCIYELPRGAIGLVSLAWYTEVPISLNANDPPMVVCTINEGSYGLGPNKTRLSVR